MVSLFSNTISSVLPRGKTEMIKICFVILHYGDISVTENCVSSISRISDIENIRIIIVDNDVQKSDVKRQKLTEKYRKCAQIKVLQMREKCGFSKANNVGYRYGKFYYDPEYMVICNNDIEFVQKDFIERLDHIYRENPFAVLGPDVVRIRNQEHQNPMDTRMRTMKEAEYTIRMNRIGLKYFSLLYPGLYLQHKSVEKKKLKEKEKKADWYKTQHEDIVPFGACLIFSKDFIQKEENAFEPETQFYYEEYILAYRCYKKQYRILYDPLLQVLHESGAATKKTFGSMRKQMKFRMERTMEAAQIYKSVVNNEK